MTDHVFISYRHDEAGEYVERLVTFLTEAGLTVWYDKEVVAGGRWEHVIRDRIDSCAACIVVMTPAAERSDWVANEVEQARLMRRPIMPLLLAGTRFFSLAALQYEDVTDGSMPGPAFVARIRAFVADAAGEREAADAERLPTVLTGAGSTRPAGAGVNGALGDSGTQALLIDMHHLGDGGWEPAAGSAGLVDLGTALVHECGLPPANLRLVLNPRTAEQVEAELSAAALRASGLLLVYILGSQSIVDGALQFTAVDGPPLSYQRVRGLLDIGDASSLVILDGECAAVAGGSPPRRGALIASCAHGAENPPDFARRLAAVLRDGLVGGPPSWSVHDLKHAVPGAMVFGALTNLVLATNQAVGPGAAALTAPAHGAESIAGAPTKWVVQAKIIIAGGPGTGKRELIAAVSEIAPLTAAPTVGGQSQDHDPVATDASPGSVDFGRVSVDGDLVLYLQSIPDQIRLWFFWDDLTRGAIGAVVLVDTRRLADCFSAIDFFEHRRLPYVIGVVCPDGVQHYDSIDVRVALAIPPSVPVLPYGPSDWASAKDLILGLTSHVLSLRRPGS